MSTYNEYLAALAEFSGVGAGGNRALKQVRRDRETRMRDAIYVHRAQGARIPVTVAGVRGQYASARTWLAKVGRQNALPVTPRVAPARGVSDDEFNGIVGAQARAVMELQRAVDAHERALYLEYVTVLAARQRQRRRVLVAAGLIVLVLVAVLIAALLFR
ncbi:hypothetical protein [Amycolatopsis sp. H20-H5]|uniref:hypothetical protein n=1 Tax=Amycolatopsis sp. H20-H5 TaxID=3046309 RepID=UPI002DB8EA11|nr:hypothetical protein [Amycolatopsis sp. H20-H5]MEC3977168.1 hypothetical protein [Amycolatopsis sp. H20-H5]